MADNEYSYPRETLHLRGGLPGEPFGYAGQGWQNAKQSPGVTRITPIDQARNFNPQYGPGDFDPGPSEAQRSITGDPTFSFKDFGSQERGEHKDAQKFFNQSMKNKVDSSGYTEDEYRSIGNEFLKLIGPTILGQGGNQNTQNQPPNQSPGPQRKMVDGALPSPEVLKSFSKGMAPKLRSVLEGYGSQMQRGGQMAPQQMAPQQMVPPQFMGGQLQYMGSPMEGPQNPNIYRDLNQPTQMQQGPFQSFNPYQTSAGGY